MQAFVESEPIEFAWTEVTKEDILLINYIAVHAGPVSWGGSRAMLQTYGWGYGATSDCAEAHTLYARVDICIVSPWPSGCDTHCTTRQSAVALFVCVTVFVCVSWCQLVPVGVGN